MTTHPWASQFQIYDLIIISVGGIRSLTFPFHHIVRFMYLSASYLSAGRLATLQGYPPYRNTKGMQHFKTLHLEPEPLKHLIPVLITTADRPNAQIEPTTVGGCTR